MGDYRPRNAQPSPQIKLEQIICLFSEIYVNNFDSQVNRVTNTNMKI